VAKTRARARSRCRELGEDLDGQVAPPRGQLIAGVFLTVVVMAFPRINAAQHANLLGHDAALATIIIPLPRQNVLDAVIPRTPRRAWSVLSPRGLLHVGDVVLPGSSHA
jgi:hypothetical protein